MTEQQNKLHSMCPKFILKLIKLIDSNFPEAEVKKLIIILCLFY